MDQLQGAVEQLQEDGCNAISCQSSQVTTGYRVLQAMLCRYTVIWRGCVGVMKGGGGEEGG